MHNRRVCAARVAAFQRAGMKHQWSNPIALKENWCALEMTGEISEPFCARIGPFSGPGSKKSLTGANLEAMPPPKLFQ